MDKTEKTAIIICTLFVIAMLSFCIYVIIDINKNSATETIQFDANTNKWNFKDYTEAVFAYGASWGYAEAIKRQKTEHDLSLSEAEIGVFVEKAKKYWRNDMGEGR